MWHLGESVTDYANVQHCRDVLELAMVRLSVMLPDEDNVEGVGLAIVTNPAARARKIGWRTVDTTYSQEWQDRVPRILRLSKLYFCNVAA